MPRSYDDHFRLHGVAVTDGASITYGYDGDGILTQAGDMVATPDSANGMLASTALGDLTTSQGYLATGESAGYGELMDFSAGYDSTTLFSTQLERDDLGRITSKTEGVIDGSNTLQTDLYEYTYDDAGRLWQVYLNSNSRERPGLPLPGR